MAGIPTSNILQPGVIAVAGGVPRALISDLQLLTPQSYNKYTDKYGKEAYDNFFMWMATFGGMEEVKNRNFFWFESRGKNQIAVTNLTAVSAPAAGATVTVTIAAGDVYDTDYSALRVGETVRVASSNIEGVILTVPAVNQCTIRPKQSTQAFVSAGSADLQASEVLIFGGQTDVGEASGTREPQVHLDQRYENNITEIREDWSATDLAEMTEVYYNSVSGSSPAQQAGTSLFTLKGLRRANQRFLNSIESKLMRGDIVNNTGLLTSTSVGTQGFIPKILEDGEEVNYTPGTLDIAKIHEITRIMDVNGCAKENLWLMDIYQRQNFSDGIFAEYPAGAYVWGQGDKSEEAAIAYGVQSFSIDGYLFKAKKYAAFNTEVQTGKTPTNDYFRNFGVIAPQGTTNDAKDGTKVYKNIQVLYQTPLKGGTTGNAIRVWNHGGGSINATNGTLKDEVSMVTSRGLRVTGANQFMIVQG
jgi:hypothetical protein